MKSLNDAKTKKRRFLVPVGLLLAFSVIWQIGIDKISFEREHDQYWEYDFRF